MVNVEELEKISNALVELRKQITHIKRFSDEAIEFVDKVKVVTSYGEILNNIMPEIIEKVALLVETLKQVDKAVENTDRVIEETLDGNTREMSNSTEMEKIRCGCSWNYVTGESPNYFCGKCGEWMG